MREGERRRLAEELIGSEQVTQNDISGELVLAFRQGKFTGIDFTSDLLKRSIVRLGLAKIFDGF
jgi:hypothetical protein